MTPEKLTALITGANRGIGLGLVIGYLEQGYQVIACCRQPQTAIDLQKLLVKYPQQLNVEALDVTHVEHFQELSRKYSNTTIDILINNAGIFPETHSRDGITAVKHENVSAAFATNALGPLLAIQTFQKNLLQSAQPKIINISSQMGSLAAVKGFGYSYRLSKVALNMLTRAFAEENKQIITIALRPGWVKTDMGGTNANISVSESVDKMIKLIAGLTIADSGGFFDNDKNSCEW